VGVVRGKRQVFTVDTKAMGGVAGGGEVDVALGVNGYCWVSRHVDPEANLAEKEKVAGKGRVGGPRGNMSISNLDELVSNQIYSSQNDEIDARTRTEIARLCGCITLLSDASVKVDEETVVRAYRAAVAAEMEMMVDEGEDVGVEMKNQLKKRIVQAVVGGG
jgi:exosome complex component RRP4